MHDLVSFFDGLLYSGSRFLYAFYSNNEFELCTTQNITLNASLAAILKFPTQIAAGVCLSSHVDPDSFIDVFRGYSVQLIGSGVRGMSTDVPTAETYKTVAILPRSGSCEHTPYLPFETVPSSFYVQVFAISADNGIVELNVPDDSSFEVVFDLS